MKYLIGSVLLVSVSISAAFEVRVHKMTLQPGMDRSFNLATETIPDKMVLDCQSFVQGLTVGEEENEAFFFLDPQECEDLYLRTNQSLKKRKNHCLELQNVIVSDYTCA